MTTTVVNLRDFPLAGRRRVLPDDVVRVDRAGPYGNPHRIAGEVTRADALKLYRQDVERSEALTPGFIDMYFGRLRGKRLACWCRPPEGFGGRLLCHGQLIAGWLDRIPPEYAGDAHPFFLPRNMPALEAYWSDYQRIRDRGDLA